MENKEAVIRQHYAYMQAIAAEARGPYRAQSAVPQPNNVLEEILLPTFVNARVKAATAEAMQEVLRTEVAPLPV